ncbi:MAG: TGS domain-containing protein [Deltaproteobacteria bacterium]|nr:TGS domain-containing protein [Deltaproteobacteria bacterium]MBW2154005.1 TGS domain-containing protein [Deltaproteobacteria bacterium]
MPANLPPDYFDAERRYREARTHLEKIACLEEMLTIMPKHKGTDKLRADLRRRISKLKEAVRTKKGVSRRESAFHIEKEGAGQVAVVGPPNVGKSALVAKLTNATPEVADFPHTTWKPTPGMMPVDDIQIQLIDTPPLSQQYVEPALVDLIRKADLILLLVDLQTDPVKQLEDTVALLEQYRIVPKRFQDRLGVQRGFTYIPFLVLANKNDDADSEENFTIFSELLEDDWPMISISVKTGRNLELLKRKLVERLEIIRVYSKAPGKTPDMTAPFILKKGSTVEEFAEKVHKDFSEKLKIARVWGEAVYDGQAVQRDHVLRDGDVVELHI